MKVLPRLQRERERESVERNCISANCKYYYCFANLIKNANVSNEHKLYPIAAHPHPPPPPPHHHPDHHPRFIACQLN